MTFLGKVGVGISKQHLLEGHFQAYDIVFIILDEEDEYAGNISLLPEETCVSIRFCGGHSQSSDYYSRLMQYIEENHYSVNGFSKEVTMIDYGLTNDVSQFITEIQIPVCKPE